MGGHAGGEIAAQIAVRLFIERFQQEAKPILKNPLKFLQDSMQRAHAALGSTPTSSRCWRLRARHASRASCRRATRTGRTSAIRAFTSTGRAV
jgi:hypothetical protein